MRLEVLHLAEHDHTAVFIRLNDGDACQRGELVDMRPAPPWGALDKAAYRIQPMLLPQGQRAACRGDGLGTARTGGEEEAQQPEGVVARGVK